MNDRIFVEWESGAYLTSLDLNFQANLADLTKQYGKPSLVEFRAAGEGFLSCPCGQAYASVEQAEACAVTERLREEDENEPFDLHEDDGYSSDDGVHALPGWCSGGCAHGACHRCFPRASCTEHQKCSDAAKKRIDTTTKFLLSQIGKSPDVIQEAMRIYIESGTSFIALVRAGRDLRTVPGFLAVLQAMKEK